MRYARPNVRFLGGRTELCPRKPDVYAPFITPKGNITL